MNILNLTHPLNGLLMIAFAIGLGVFLTRKFHTGWGLWGIGAATFVLSQVGHIPFNLVLTRLFQRGLLPAPPPEYHLVFNAAVLGLSAGLWEELARYAAYRWWARQARSWRAGLLLGAGHGGIEAILLGVLVLWTYLQMAALHGADLSRWVPADQLALASQQIEQYWSLPWAASLLGAWERLFTLLFHLSLSLLVLQTFTRKQSRWLWLAVAWHALADGLLVIVMGRWGVYPSEGLVALLGLAGLGIVRVLYRPEPQPPEPAPLEPVRPLTDFQLPPLEETPENLENTRYQQ